ncbi:MAG: hypothetical protein KAQ67_07155 [Gammaproteobacteria bacterium]|nr:hypothetical protein [Gammaproteobacteria bacterium]
MKNRLFVLISLLYSLQSQAFDNDFSINRPNFNTENFLDISYVQFSDQLDEQWYQTENGWRIASHSLTKNLLYTNTEVKLFNELSDSVNIRLNYQQEVYYIEKDIPSPQLEVEIRPYSDYEISFSIIGTAEYQKKNSELGAAITFGKLTSNFLRLSDITVDNYFNEKNDSLALYLKDPHIRTIETAYQWSPSLNARFKFSDFSPMEFLYNDQVTLFEHQGYQYDGFIKYKLNKGNIFKLSIKGFETDKSITGTTNQSQQLKYNSIDLKWMTHQQQPYQLTFGFRDDHFTNEIINTTNSNIELDYLFTTRQIYSAIHHPYTTLKAWELGLYLGLTKEPNDFENPGADFSRVYESKLTTSWIFHSKNKKSSIFLHLSWDLDGTIKDPGDGGGITYQSTF